MIHGDLLMICGDLLLIYVDLLMIYGDQCGSSTNDLLMNCDDH